MNANPASVNWNALLASALGLAATGVVAACLASSLEQKKEVER